MTRAEKNRGRNKKAPIPVVYEVKVEGLELLLV